MGQGPGILPDWHASCYDWRHGTPDGARCPATAGAGRCRLRAARGGGPPRPHPAPATTRRAVGAIRGLGGPRPPAWCSLVCGRHGGVGPDCEDFEKTMVTTARPPLLCLSHLRWDYVWQRPQHVMSRLAQDRQLFFVEEPLFRPEAPPVAQATLEVRQEDGVTVARPVCRDPGPGGGPALDAMYVRLVAELVRTPAPAGCDGLGLHPHADARPRRHLARAGGVRRDGRALLVPGGSGGAAAPRAPAAGPGRPRLHRGGQPGAGQGPPARPRLRLPQRGGGGALPAGPRSAYAGPPRPGRASPARGPASSG